MADHRQRGFRAGAWVALAVLLAAGAGAAAERIKDIADLQGVRSNPLWGYGLVIGLNGTGDGSEISRRALTNVLRRSGLVLDPDDLDSSNIASVLVTADLPPFGRKGGQIDVTVSTIGDAESLQGGTLLLTPLVGADGQVYAVSQGQLVVGGYSASGQQSSVTKNHPTVGTIPNGATIEKEELATFVQKGEITLQLKNPDFATARRMAEAINGAHDGAATAADAGTVRVKLPEDIGKNNLIAFVDSVETLEVEVDAPALVVINERTGTIIVGQNVKISTAAISHGNLTVITQEEDLVSQPQPFSRTGTTERTHRTRQKITEERRSLHVVPRQVSVSELARALNAMGLTPRDLISIFEALKKAEALQAELKIM